jgi:Uncharacterized protein conserved in bacteria (DUF2252)
MPAKAFKEADADYEAWLRLQLDGDVVERDLARKRKKMAQGPFPFLRATYWRWAETILDVCPHLAGAPSVLAVGDIHLENYGTWRDDDGRLVWGVNDFDEAAEMPYALDLVRLGTSAALARPSDDAVTGEICAAITEGYAKGLKEPRPFVLDEEHEWLRNLVVVPEQERAQFWEKIDALEPADRPPAERYRKAIESSLPEPGIEIAKFCPRRAGTGSLGRPRWVGVADWRGARLIREAKALVMSGWTRVPGNGPQTLRCKEIAFGRYRAPDRWFDVLDNTAVRRLSPNNRKIEVKAQSDDLLDTRMLGAMGHELANVHLGTGEWRAAVENDLANRPAGWLREAVRDATRFVADEFNAWAAEE